MNATGDANKAQTEEGLQYHIQLKKGDLPNIVLMPGDPKRVEKIASNWDVSEKMRIFGNGKNCHFVGNTNVANFCGVMDIFQNLFSEVKKGCLKTVLCQITLPYHANYEF